MSNQNPQPQNNTGSTGGQPDQSGRWWGNQPQHPTQSPWGTDSAAGYTRSWTAADVRGGPQPQARFGQPAVGGAGTGSAASGGQPPHRSRNWLKALIPAVALVAALGGGVLGGAIAGAPDNDTAASTTRVVQSDGANPDWTQTAAAASPSVVSIQVASGQGSSEGSGVVLDQEGRIATNNHVVASGANGQIQVTLSDRQVYRAQIVGTDPSTDLAVIQLVDPPKDLTPITFADSEQLDVGQPVMAIGNPLGLSETVTTGIVSATDRPVITQTEQQNPTASTGADQAATNAIQTSAAINPGNSGGALVNANGELVGITSSIATVSGGSGQSGNIGIGFAIPSNEVRSVTDQLVATGTADHAWLGVGTTDEAGTTGEGTVIGAGVAQVVPNSPAAQAGLTEGDVITKINGEPVTGSEALMASIRGLQVGEKVTLGVIRDGEETETAVTLAASPQS